MLAVRATVLFFLDFINKKLFLFEGYKFCGTFKSNLLLSSKISKFSSKELFI